MKKRKVQLHAVRSFFTPDYWRTKMSSNRITLAIRRIQLGWPDVPAGRSGYGDVSLLDVETMLMLAIFGVVILYLVGMPFRGDGRLYERLMHSFVTNLRLRS
jgi:hypothetical protein